MHDMQTTIFPIGILGQVWYLIVSIPDLCNLTFISLVLVNGAAVAVVSVAAVKKMHLQQYLQMQLQHH